MSFSVPRGALAGAVVLLAGLFAAAPAGATVTSSHISAYSGHTFESYDVSDTNDTRTVSGTAVAAPGDTIIVKCVVAGNITGNQMGSATVQLDGTFSVTGRVPDGFDPCNLYAVGQGAPDLTGADKGPLVYPGARRTWNGASGLYDWGVDRQPEKHGFADFYSLGDCGLCDMKWRGDAGDLSQYLWYQNDALVKPSFYGGTEVSDGSVDGSPVFPPYTMNQNAMGFLPLTFDYALDGATGVVTVKSTEPLMTCTDAPAVMDAANCQAAGDSGLRVDRTIRYDHDGQVWRGTDVIRNVSSGNRSFDLRLMNSQNSGFAGNGVQLPGESGFQTWIDRGGAKTTVPGSSAAISTIYATYDGHSEIDQLANPVGSVTTSPSPEQVIFYNESRFLLRFTGTIPAGGSKTITHVYTMGGTLAGTQALASEAEDSLAGPSVAIASPANGATVSTSAVTVSGTASDNKGVASVTVNGIAAAVGSGGTWTATLALGEGANTITAVANDATGNSATATSGVTYTKPVPPVRPATVKHVRKPSTSAKGSTITVDTGASLSCPAGGPSCSATVKLSTIKAFASKAKKRKQTLGTAKLTVAPGKTVKLKVKLTKAGAKLLRKQHKLRILVTTVSRAGTTAAHTVKKTITIKAPHKKKAHKKKAHKKH